jgi:hypothetical protein
MHLKQFAGRHQHGDCLILGCGPSLNDFTDDQLKELCQDKVVFSIKQAFNRIPYLTNYHFLNSANIVQYVYPQPIPIILELAKNEIGWANQIPHHILVLVNNNTDFSQSLVATKDFDSWSFSESEARPWGPGLMYEVVLFMAQHMGFLNVYTIGWDMGAPGSTRREHFYGSHRNTMNPANPLEPDESQREIETSKYFYEWLKSKGTNLFIASKNSYAHSDIPRVDEKQINSSRQEGVDF